MKSILSDLLKACEVTPFWLFGSCPTVLSVADAAGKNHRLIMANKSKAVAIVTRWNGIASSSK